MIYTMYSIKDRLNGYTIPIPMLSDDLAKRYFKDQILGNPTLKNSPEDFTIEKVGVFNTETGEFTQPKIEILERGAAYVTSNSNS